MILLWHCWMVMKPSSAKMEQVCPWAKAVHFHCLSIMKNLPFIILDDVTANIDLGSSLELASAIEALTKE